MFCVDANIRTKTCVKRALFLSSSDAVWVENAGKAFSAWTFARTWLCHVSPCRSSRNAQPSD